MGRQAVQIDDWLAREQDAAEIRLMTGRERRLMQIGDKLTSAVDIAGDPFGEPFTCRMGDCPERFIDRAARERHIENDHRTAGRPRGKGKRSNGR